MAGEWSQVAVEEIKAQSENSLATGPFGSSIGSRFFTDSGVPVIRGSNLSQDIGTRLNDQGLVFVSPDKAREFSRSIVRDGDLVFTCWGTVNQVGLIDRRSKHREYIISNKQMKLTPDPAKADSLFLYYLFSGPELQHRIKNQSIGSSVPGFNLGQLRTMQIRIPEVEEQRAIAHILGTLDDKIELNRRMNETLEAMARALFQSWFVDFDPGRAKAEGRDPRLPRPLADLFPDRFKDSELGEIPAGWEMGRLGDVLQQRVERCDASTETVARPYVPIDCISSKSLFLTESKPGEEAQSSLTRFYKGDLLFGAMRPYFHKVCIAPFDGTTRTTAFVLFPRRREDFGFATLLLHHPDTIDYATRHSTGSTIPYAVWSNSLQDMTAIVPPSVVREAFDGIVRPILDRIPEPYFENKTLAALRDTLLPKLISGELRVKDAEAAAATA